MANSNTMEFKEVNKLVAGDTVAIVSPSFAAPAVFPEVYQFGLGRLANLFELYKLEFPATGRLDASLDEKASDLMAAFRNSEVKAVIATIGGDIQVTYIHKMLTSVFVEHPKAFFGYSDNSHFCNYLWLRGIPSYYGASILCQFAMQGEMDAYTVKYLRHAFFDKGLIELHPSPEFNDQELSWGEPENLIKRRRYQANDGWYWDGTTSAEGITWGGCLESIDEMLRHGVPIPTLNQFAEVVLFLETSEEIPSADYVFRVLRALGERGILERVRGILVGRPKAWKFDNQKSDQDKLIYKEEQRTTILRAVRQYNTEIPVVQNLDFGHTDPQICLPVGRKAILNSDEQKIFVEF
jgi:muramoyltetrapeptide carboxypeptidase LdcA involved in peptidoglycan recycling